MHTKGVVSVTIACWRTWDGANWVMVVEMRPHVVLASAIQAHPHCCRRPWLACRSLLSGEGFGALTSQGKTSRLRDEHDLPKKCKKGSIRGKEVITWHSKEGSAFSSGDAKKLWAGTTCRWGQTLRVGRVKCSESWLAYSCTCLYPAHLTLTKRCTAVRSGCRTS